jgi:hypothetical protein
VVFVGESAEEVGVHDRFGCCQTDVVARVRISRVVPRSLSRRNGQGGGGRAVLSGRFRDYSSLDGRDEPGYGVSLSM